MQPQSLSNKYNKRAMRKTDLQTYFIERIRELYDRKTLDSYRVSCHNSLSLIGELIRVIERWQSHKVKHVETVIACIQETRESLENDICINFSFFDKELFIKEFAIYEKALNNSTKNTYSLSQRFLIFLRRGYELNKKCYLSNLLNQIESILFSPEELTDNEFMPCVNMLDKLVTSLACELLQRGFSKEYLYHYVNKSIKLPSFYDDFIHFRERIEKEGMIEYTVILKILLPEKYSDILPDKVFIKVVPNEYRNEGSVRKMLCPGTSVRFFIDIINAMDHNAAVKIARNHLSSELDKLHLGLFSFNAQIHNRAAVFRYKNGILHTTIPVTHFFLDGNYSKLPEVSKQFRLYLQNIKSNFAISNDVKDRLESALRHLRLGNTASENEQRFINYWIALEFIFSSAFNEESTFSRLKENLLTVLYVCYIKRNLLYLNTTLQSIKLIDQNEYYWEKQNVDGFIQSQTRLILRYHLQRMKSHILKNNAIKDYLKNHEKRLSWHLIRIYRLRNELIHEAAIVANMEDITSNLRYYLVFLLNQMIVYYKDLPKESKEKYTIEDFFMEFTMFNKKIRKNFDLDIILQMPVETDLIK